MHLDSGACQALGPNADFALLCSDGLPLKPPVLIGPFSFSASFFCGFVCSAGTLLSHQLAVTLLRPQKGDRPKWFFYFTFIFSGGVSSHSAILEGFVLLFALLWAHPGLEMPNFERCWGWCCCMLHLVSGACHALGPNADFALLCSDGLPLKPPVL